MLICMIGYIVVNGYTGVEALTVFWILGYRMVEAVADVYSGLFQQRERIDISGKDDVNAERNFNDYIHNYIMVNRQPVICGYDTYN